MSIIQGLIETEFAGRPKITIVNNNPKYDVVNYITSNVIFTILNGGSILVGTTVYSNLITNYIDGVGGSSQWTSSGTKIYYNTSNVGIGTTDPLAPLHIYNTSNVRLLVDTITTGTATVEFRRGIGADMQNDYRFINDTDGNIKLQFENSTQAFSNLSANLAWFSSNETIIHKNTSMNGRVGIGTTYHATRSLDVVGSVNISGTLSVASSNSIITNSLTNSTSLVIHNGIIPQTSSTSSSIEFIRGTAADTNRDYKLGNYGAEFKVISSTSGVDTDYIKITTAGAIFNPSGTASWNTSSDRRIKENIERASYDKCYENINKLELNRFNYVEGFNMVSRDKKQLGFIAQEVYDIFPKAISSHEYYTDTLSIPNLLSIDISQINYSLYGAVKKLIEINEEDEKHLNSFNNRIKTIKTILNIAMELTTSNLLDTSSNVILDTSNILDT
uniref:Peptidase S74 domain-containing protein n=1 Tax=viral metagenome TaxID=1070528 RepID=A0A6C0K6M8_9ZZZZ